MPESPFQGLLDELKRANAHDEHYYEWSAERLAHWSEISLDRINRIKAGTPPTEQEACKIINAIGGKLRKMLPHEVFGEILAVNSTANSTKRGAAIADDSERTTARNYRADSVPSKILLS